MIDRWERGSVIVGDIHWGLLLGANGRAPRGHRPAVILQDAQDAARLPVCWVVSLATARGAMRFARTALSRPTAENGRRQASVAWVFQPQAIDPRRMQERIGGLRAAVLHEALAEFANLMGRAE